MRFRANVHSNVLTASFLETVAQFVANESRKRGKTLFALRVEGGAGCFKDLYMHEGNV